MNKNVTTLTAAILLSTLIVGCDYAEDDDIDRLEAEIEELKKNQDQGGSNGDQGDGKQPFSMTILHINDHHSHLAADDFDYDVSDLDLSAKTASGEAVKEVEVTFGGFPMLVDVFETLESQNDNVLKIHAGDAITGTLYYTLFGGAADAALMNQICFDAFALGNHEFDGGDSGLAVFLDDLNSGACDTKTLAANVTPAGSSAIADGYIQPYFVKEIGGQKIGMIGIDIAQKTKQSSRPDAGTEFTDETQTSQRYIDELKAQGVDKIVLITHYQYENDRVLARNLSGVDVIVGGDSHTLLGDETFKNLGFNPLGDYPTIETNKDGDTVCIVQAWEYAHLMGKLTVNFDKDGKVSSCMGHPVMPVSTTFSYEYSDDEDRTLNSVDSFTVAKELTADEEVVVSYGNAATETLLTSLSGELEALKQQSIGSVATDLCLDRWPGQARSLICDASATYERGSDISNLVAKAFLTVTPTADVAIQNAGGVRVDVASGNYTIADAFTLLPFSNTLVTLELTGAQIKSVLEDALANTLDNGGSTGSYPYASGLRYHVNASAPAGQRISNLEINPRVSGNWSAIDTNQTYTVVTNDFIASGRDGYATFGQVFSEGKYVDTFTEYAQGFVDYMKGLNGPLNKLSVEEYSTQRYVGRDGCDHSTNANCESY